MSGKKSRIVFVTLLLAVQICLVRQSAAETVNVDAALLQQLQDAIQQQQQQLQKQSEILESLQQQVIDLKQTAAEAQAEAHQAKSAAQRAVDTTEKARTAIQASSDKVVISGQERVKLAISGQVNRAVNIADDGKSTKAYFVDNDASNTRFRLVGTGKVTDDLTIGSRLEVALISNESSEVSQDDETPGNFSDMRWAEVSIDSKRFGKLSLGKGDTASNNSAEVDLSRTNVVQYAGVAAIAGGLQFRDNDDNLTGVKVSNAFNNLDGLSRQDRVRYDTPSFHGFHLAGSAVSDQRWDATLWWGGQGYGFKTAGATAVSDPNLDNVDLQYDGSFSILHESTGLNLTLSGGVRDQDDGDDSTNLYAKAGWIASLFPFGDSAFGVDYTWSTNFPTGSDDGYSFGAAAVQELNDYGTDIYAQYRLYSLDRDDSPDVQNIHVGTIGARVKF